MAIAVLSLATGEILNVTSGSPPTPPTTNELYGAPTSPAKAAIVKSITLVNKHTSAVTVNLYLKKGAAAARFISPINMSIAVGSMAIFDQEITMGSGDKIHGDSSSANKVEFVVSGVERDV